MSDKKLVVVASPDLKGQLNEWLYEKTHGVVQSGPFKGMVLLSEENWQDGNLGTKLLGCYEQELHHIVESEIERLSGIEAPKIVDIGCAEGYYAVGMIRRLPQAAMFPIDSDEATQALCWKAAEANKVSHRFFKSDTIEEALLNADLVICDCEGAEIEYLDKQRFPSLSKASIIVECHDFGPGAITNALLSRFSDTHEIYGADEGGRNPHEFAILWSIHSHARWLAVSEGRPFMMHWLYMVPKEHAA